MRNPSKLLLRVAARFQRIADLMPPLGKPGGPCQVIQRIEDNVRNPALKGELEREVGTGHTLSNPDASKIYPLDREPGAGRIKNLLISSHAQYRMDLRSVTVEDVQRALTNWSKALNDLKSQKNPSYDRMIREMNAGSVEWNDPKSGLFLVFEVRGDQAAIITTYWKGQKDPRAVPPAACARR
jgi:hypothetical protein